MSKQADSVAAVIGKASVVVCAGAGGVGKTTTAAALALCAAHSGRRVVVVTIDPARRLADAIGVALSHDPCRVQVDAPGELWAVMLDTPATFDELVQREAPTPAHVERILANRFYKNLSGSLSGTQEYMAAEKLYQLHSDPRFDLVVVDTPPTRNALDFLDAPARLVRFFDHRLYRTLIKPSNVGLKVVNVAAQTFLKTLSRIVGGDVIADAIAFFQLFEGMEPGFRARADAVSILLRSRQTAYVLVTSARREAIDDAEFFAERLRDKDLRVGAVVANRVQPVFAPELTTQQVEAQVRATALGALWANLALLRHAADAEREALASLTRAAGVRGAATAEVPLLDHDVHDMETLTQIAGFLAST